MITPLLTRGENLFENYLLVNTKACITGSDVTFAYFDVDWMLRESVARQNNETVQESDGEVNEAYLSIRLANNLLFNAGKKRALWGVGFAYNPTDFIDAPVSPFDPELKQGVYSSELSFFHHAYSLDSIVVFYDRPEYCGYGVKFSAFSLFPQTDLNVMGYYSKNDRLNLGVSAETTPFEAIFWRGLALYGEVGLIQVSVYKPELRGDDFYKQWLAGLRYIHPETETSVVFEYYYLEDGFDEKERKAVLWRQPQLSIPRRSARHNIFLNIRRAGITKNRNPFTDTLSLSTRIFGNPEDRSRMITAILTSEWIRNTQISLEGTWYAGGDYTEYGALPMKEAYSLSVSIPF